MRLVSLRILELIVKVSPISNGDALSATAELMLITKRSVEIIISDTRSHRPAYPHPDFDKIPPDIWLAPVDIGEAVNLSSSRTQFNGYLNSVA